jgi:hypothetical protein
MLKASQADRRTFSQGGLGQASGTSLVAEQLGELDG